MVTLEFKAGDLVSYDLQWTEVVNGSQAPKDLTGNTLTAQAKLGSFTGPITVTPIDLSVGKFRLSVLPAASALWPAGATVPFDIKRTWGANTAKRSVTGYFRVIQGITP
jgi:hypothetical protein